MIIAAPAFQCVLELNDQLREERQESIRHVLKTDLFSAKKKSAQIPVSHMFVLDVMFAVDALELSINDSSSLNDLADDGLEHVSHT